MKAPASPWPAVVAFGILVTLLLGLVALGQTDLAVIILLALFFAIMLMLG